MCYCIVVYWQNVGDYFFPPVKLHELENFKEPFDDRVMQFYSRLNWKIASHTTVACASILRGHLRFTWRIAEGLMHHGGTAGNWERLQALSKREGQPSQRAMVHLLSSPRNKYIDFLNLPKQEGDHGLTLRNTPWQSSFMKPGTASVLWNSHCNDLYTTL